jgi:hypothetical protein
MFPPLALNQSYSYPPTPVVTVGNPAVVNPLNIQPSSAVDTLDLKNSPKELKPKKKHKKKPVAPAKNGWLLPVGIGVGAIAIAGITLYAMRENPKVKAFLDKFKGGASKKAEESKPSSGGGGKPSGSGGSNVPQFTPEQMAEAQQWFEEAKNVKTYAEAEVKLKAAAERQHMEALLALGIIQMRMGKIAEALVTYEKGANEGITGSQIELAKLLSAGVGQVNNEPNYKHAYFWAYLAKERDASIFDKINEDVEASAILTDQLKLKIEEIAETKKLAIAEKTKNLPKIPFPTTP